jgi:cell division septal protein FtsQ
MRREKRQKKIDYSRKQYRNPFFSQKHNQAKQQPQDKWLLLKAFGVAMVAVTLICGSVWAICFSPWFSIINLSVSVPAKISQPDVEGLAWQCVNGNRWLVIPQRNLIFTDTSGLENELKQRYVLGGISIKKNWPHGLAISLQEKPYHAVWQENSKKYLINKDDFVATEATDQEINEKKLPLISNSGQPKISEGKLTNEQDCLTAILAVSSKIAAKPDRLGIKHFEVSNDLASGFMGVTAGPKIIFNTREDLDRQVNKYEAVLTQGLKGELAQKKYIDLRFGDKLFYQ